MERLTDKLIGDVWAVVIAGVDMVDTGRHCLAKNSYRLIAILRWPEHTGSGELHRAIAKSLYGAIAKRERPGGADIGHAISPVLQSCI